MAVLQTKKLIKCYGKVCIPCDDMLKGKLKITIVGAGKYGRELIAPTYKKNKKVVVNAFISRSASKKKLEEGTRDNIRIIRSAGGWKKVFGKPTKNDVFDIALFPEDAIRQLKELVKIGARNFILPKPVATTVRELKSIVKLQKKYKLSILVSSQWYYSEITQQISKEMKKINGMQIAKLNFSQCIENKEGNRYTPINALLPHLLQIAYSAGLIIPKKRYRTKVEKTSASSIKVTKTSGNQTILLESDIQSVKKERMLQIYDQKGKIVITVDFLSEFKDRRCVRPLAIWKNGHSQEIYEDTLGKMVDQMVNAFIQRNIQKNKTILTFKKYLPIINEQIQIGKKYALAA